MTEYVRGFVIPDVADTHQRFLRCIGDAEKLAELERRTGKDVGAKLLIRQLTDAYNTLNVNLRESARLAAVNATKGMVERLDSTRRRPESGSVPPLRDLVVATPLSVGRMQTGAVGIANLALLERARNPLSHGYGSYWRAQEYGTGQGEVASQVGRILFGSFADAGGAGPSAPQGVFAGGGGPHPVFVSGNSLAAGPGTVGFGTITHEIVAKHFIAWGADEARIGWRADIAQLQSRALNELKAIRLGAVGHA